MDHQCNANKTHLLPRVLFGIAQTTQLSRTTMGFRNK
jgi:hypothetical protein